MMPKHLVFSSLKTGFALLILLAAIPLPAQAPQPPEPVPAGYTGQETPDEAGVTWAPAAATNFTVAERPRSHPMDTIVIHDIEGSAMGAVNWFQNPKARVSAHYVVDAVDGKVWQQVLEKDIGWHAGNWDVNTRSVGIEHEGYAYRPGFYTPTLYEASARLVRDIGRRHNIPLDRQHIIGHAEVPNPREAGKFGGAGGHTDPGPYWDWDYFMTLVRNDARLEDVTEPVGGLLLHPGEKVEIRTAFTNTGEDAWPANPTMRRNPAAQEKGPVYLGVSRQNYSPFFGAGWVSPRIAAPPREMEILPNGTATFTLSLTAPLASGSVSETFRLVKVPISPRIPVPFGPTFTITARIEPWDIIWDAAHAGFTALYWYRNTVNGRPIFWQKAPENPASWQGALPVAGEWEIYARWTTGPARTGAASYEVITGEGPVSIPINQREQGGTWVKLGRFPLADAKAVKVSLQTDGKGIVIADALRFVGPFPK